MLELNVSTTFCIEKSPLRSNLCYNFIYIEKNTPLEIIFRFLIKEVKQENTKTPRTLIFCQTRKQCAILFRTISVALGTKMYVNEEIKPEMRLVEMFHAGTPQTVKNHVITEMTKHSSHLRVLICTVAFGMGIDCKDVYRSVHFGPSKTVETLIQECGRLGRDGKPCVCYILYNGFLTAHCDEQMKKLIHSKDSCRRKQILKLFTAANDSEVVQWVAIAVMFV